MKTVFTGLFLALMCGTTAFADHERNEFTGECRHFGGMLGGQDKAFHLVGVRGNSYAIQEMRFSVRNSDDAVITVSIAGFTNANASFGFHIRGQNRPIALSATSLSPDINRNGLGLTAYLSDGSRIRCSGALTRE